MTHAIGSSLAEAACFVEDDLAGLVDGALPTEYAEKGEQADTPRLIYSLGGSDDS